MKKLKKVPVSERALMARINRKLRGDWEMLKRCREDSQGFNYLGRYYVVGIQTNTVQYINVDIESLGREIGVLKEYEAVEEEN